MESNAGDTCSRECSETTKACHVMTLNGVQNFSFENLSEQWSLSSDTAFSGPNPDGNVLNMAPGVPPVIRNGHRHPLPVDPFRNSGKLYPDLKTLDHEIESYHTLIYSYQNGFRAKASSTANKAYGMFLDENRDIEKHQFFDLVGQFEISRSKLLAAQKKLKHLSCDARGKLDSLWVTVSKELPLKGRCDDGQTVSIVWKYQVKELDRDALNAVLCSCHELEKSVIPDVIFQQYAAQVLTIKLEFFMYSLVKELLTSEQKKSLPKISSHAIYDNLALLRKYISILFFFLRKPSKDVQFIGTIKKWLKDLVSVLLQIGSVDDQLFVLNNVLRCPAGINGWAASFLQWHPNHLKKCSDSAECLDSCLTTLFMIMMPVPDRDVFLKNIKSCESHSNSSPCTCCFVVLDSEGEEEHEVKKEWKESDVLALFERISLQSVFELLGGACSLDLHHESLMQRKIALCSFLHELYLCGMNNYGGERQRNVLKVVGQFICDTLDCLASSWEKFKAANSSYSCCLQIEIDRLVFHVLYCMFFTKQSEILTFMEKLPYDSVSTKVLWNLLWIFHAETGRDEQKVLSEKDVDRKLANREGHAMLQERLVDLSPSDAICVLRTMKSMALSTSCEKQYICCISQEIMEILLTKAEEEEMLVEICEIIMALSESYQFIISSLLEVLKDAEEPQFKTASRLFSSLSLMKWVPTEADMNSLSDWLLCDSLASEKCQLSMMILSKMNWEFEDGELALPISLHRRVGMIIVQAYGKYDADASKWSVSRDIAQMLHLHAVIPNQKVGSDNGFVAWAWKLLFSLKLHIMNHPKPPWVEIFDGSVTDDDEIPDINDEKLRDLREACSEKQPAACFLVLAMTNVGHCLKLLSTEGINIISNLIEMKQHAAVIQSLYLIFPFFVKHHEHLTSNSRFLSLFSDLLHADQQILGNKMAVGSVLSKTNEMIRIQVSQVWRMTIEGANLLIKLWLQVLVELLLLQNHKVLQGTPDQIYCLLDVLAKFSVVHPDTLYSFSECLIPLLKRNQPPEDKGSFWSWLYGSGMKTASLLQSRSASKYAWFAWCVASSEVNQKPVQNLWSAVQKEMVADPKLTPEAALKKIYAESPVLSLPIHDLPIYRWCMLGLEAPVSHHLLPLIFQQFFIYYLQRVPGSSQKSIGFRYFKSGPYSSVCERLHRRLKETVEFYHKALTSRSSSPCASGEEFDSKLMYQRNYHKIFTAYLRWIEDGELFSPVCLEALNPEYYADRLKLVLDGNMNVWFDLLDRETIKDEVVSNSGLLRLLSSSMHSSFSSTNGTKDVGSTTEVEPTVKKEVLSLPSLESIKSFLQEVGSVELSSWAAVQKVIKSDQQALSAESKRFQQHIEKLGTVNKKYIELVQRLYMLKPFTEKLSRPCYKAKKCSGNAKFSVLINKTVVDCDVHERVLCNGNSFTAVVEELSKPCDRKLCLAAVHAEICVSKLVQRLKMNNFQKSEEWCKIGTSLFYDQLLQARKVFQVGGEYGCEYPPVKQFFSTCLEVLGRELISGNEDQLIPLVGTILKHSSIAGLASPFFCPENALPKTVIAIYDAVVNSVSSSSACAIFVILSKMKLREYLPAKNVPFVSRKALLKTISVGLFRCGPHPKGDLISVYEVLKRHFCVLLMHEFPDLFDDALEIMLSGVESGQLSVGLWYEIFNSLGCPFSADDHDFDKISSEIKKFATNRILSADQKIYVVSPDIHLAQVVSILKKFGEYFSKARDLHGEQMYAKYKGFVNPISILLGLMGCSLLDLACSRRITTLGPKIVYVWDLLHQAFAPWCDPYVRGNTLHFPWSPDERAEAKKMFKMFAMCIDFHNTHFKDENFSKASILSSTWEYYFHTYIRPGVRSYHFVVCHSSLNNIPWEQFHPSQNDIELMCKVLQCQIPECKKFFLDVFFRIPWLDVLDVVLPSESLYHHTNYLCCLAKLIVKFSWGCPVGKKNCILKILRKLEEMQWSLLSLDDVESIIDEYCRLSDPSNLLHGVDKPEVFVLQFLNVIFGMVPQSQMAGKFEVNGVILRQKRAMYLRKLIAFLCKAVVCHKDSNGDVLAHAIPQMLGQLSSVISKDCYHSEQTAAAVPFVRIIFVPLNFVEDESTNKKLLNAILECLVDGSKSVLRFPSVKVASHSISSVPSSVSIIECCLTALYTAAEQNSSKIEEIWNIASACIAMTESRSEAIFSASIEQNAYLTLHEWIFRKMSSITSAESRAKLLSKIVSGLKGRKPSESAERKILLIWDKVLDLALVTSAEGNTQVVRDALHTVCDDLSVLAVDKEKGGLLYSLGFGKWSSYSVSFRFICRALAAYVLCQLPENADVRLERNSPGHMTKASPAADSRSPKTAPKPSDPCPCKAAFRAVDELQYLITKKQYSGLVDHVQKTLKCIYNPLYCLTDARQLLKDLALQVCPEQPYLLLLSS